MAFHPFTGGDTEASLHRWKNSWEPWAPPRVTGQMMSDPRPSRGWTGGSEVQEGPGWEGDGRTVRGLDARGLHFPGGVARRAAAPGFLKGSRKRRGWEGG